MGSVGSRREDRPSLLEELLRQHPELGEREARGLIMRGSVLVGTTRQTKPGVRVPEGEALSLRPAPPFASRAGEKLAYALDRLQRGVGGKVLVDAGSGTGGFTDCLLRRGAAHVYSVDVGKSQLAWRLRGDPRVSVLEGTNVMSLGPSDLPVSPHAAVCDLAFRSIRGAASHLVSLVSEAWLLALVKPQFEWRRPRRDFRGVVRDAADVLDILSTLAADLAEEGLAVRAACSSGRRGRRGNQEFFYLLERASAGERIRPPDGLEAIVREGLA